MFAFVHFESQNGVISLNILIEVIAIKILEPIKYKLRVSILSQGVLTIREHTRLSCGYVGH